MEKLTILLVDHVPRNVEKEDIVAAEQITNLTSAQKYLQHLILFWVAGTTASVKVSNEFEGAVLRTKPGSNKWNDEGIIFFFFKYIFSIKNVHYEWI